MESCRTAGWLSPAPPGLVRVVVSRRIVDMLVYSIGVSVDGYINDRDGGFDWSAPDDELFAFHIEQVGGLGAYLLGRRLHERMLVWETDASMRSSEPTHAFADVWCALPKVVFSSTLDRVEGTARLAVGTLAEEVAAAVAATRRPVSIGGAALAGAAIELGLVDELRVFRHPVAVGGGTRHLPPVADVLPLTLIESRTFGSGVVFERYECARAPRS
jgi:dihydrofolate reductase